MGVGLQITRYGGGFDQEQEDAQTRASFSEQKMEDYRKKKLQKHLGAATRARFWRERFQQYGVNPDSPDPFLELTKLPLLSKQAVKQNTSEFINPKVSSRHIRWRHTSGTTGSGLIFPEDKRTEANVWATWWRFRMIHGIHRKMWCGYFGGRAIVPHHQAHSPFWRVNHPGRQIIMSGYHLGPATVAEYLKALADAKVEWLHGYPSMLGLLAKLTHEGGLKPKISGLKIITTGSENLLPWQKTTLQKVFGVPVRQHYGSAESVANFSECEHGRLHVDEDFSAVEFPDAGLGDGTKTIVGTNWANPAFPLIRYQVGDLVKLGTGVCDCGRFGRLVETIEGRNEDYLVLSDGTRIGRLDHIFKDMIRIREAQFVQNSAHHVDLMVVKDGRYAEQDERALRQELAKHLGNKIKIQIQYTDSIPRTKNGKMRLVVSQLGSNKPQKMCEDFDELSL